MNQRAAEILFFRSCSDGPAQGSGDLPADLRRMLVTWKPAAFDPKPRDLSLFPYVLWWVFEYTRIFRAGYYQIFMFKHGAEILHRTCLFPAFFRFPFMARNDVQVGDIWTAESSRGRGLSTAMLKHVLACAEGRTVWFLCDAGNAASVRLAGKVGMRLYAKGERRPRFGVGLLGEYIIRSIVKG